MRTLLIVIILAGCDSHNQTSIDAAIDASMDAPIDAPALNCSAYCDEIQGHCTGTNAQYPDKDVMNLCSATCALFTAEGSTVNDTSGNTLGCRIHYAGLPSKVAATDCPHAGPGGDLITSAPPPLVGCSGGDVCTSFCALEIKACGSLDVPLPGNPKDDTGNPLFQYRNQANCVNLCEVWDKTHVYTPTSTGDSLACRLRAAVMAATDGKTYCAHTADFPTGTCAGTAMP